MLAAPYAPDESLRLSALHHLDILDTPADHYLDTLTRLARELFNADAASITLIDQERQWFKARAGHLTCETPRSTSFCGHTILLSEAFQVPDTTCDERFADNPMVIGPPYLRFYAGYPIHAANGQAVGALCITDIKPRHLDETEIRRLKELAVLAEGYIQLRSLSEHTHTLREAIGREQRKAMLDPLTQLWNRRGLEHFYPLLHHRAAARGQSLGVIYGDLDHFKHVNDRHGHAMGDFVLWESARRLKSQLRPDDVLARIGGEEFVVLVCVLDGEELAQVAERLRQAVSATPMANKATHLTQTASFGATLASTGESHASSLERADTALYLAKRNGRDRVERA